VNVRLPKVKDLDVSVDAPPSKSYTHRALILASLATGESVIRKPLAARDTVVTCRALRSLGTPIRKENEDICITGTSGEFSCPPGCTLDMENSGTSMRLLMPVALLAGNPVLLTGSMRMQERPVGPLVDALNRLGGKIRYLKTPSCPPVCVEGALDGGDTRISGEVSSQFISALLISAPCAEKDVEIDVEGPVASRSYLDITLECMEYFGIAPVHDDFRHFSIPAGSMYRGREFLIEGDYSSASYFFAIAAVCGGRVRVRGLSPDSAQGDRMFVGALRLMGCSVICGRDYVTVEKSGDLSGITIDMSSSPDTVQTLCMVAATAKTPTRITGIAHLKYKESDRLAATVALLNSLGGDASLSGDGILIRPAPLHGGTINPGDDHRTAMSAAVLALSRGDVVIEDAECVNKSFPGFFDVIRETGIAP
jgi:3-phosphoshikimate 1-carboxyvinyltransferase